MKNNSLDIRIVADTQEDIFADLRIHKENNFLTIHDFLVENFHLDKLEMSSFFYSKTIGIRRGNYFNEYEHWR